MKLSVKNREQTGSFGKNKYLKAKCKRTYKKKDGTVVNTFRHTYDSKTGRCSKCGKKQIKLL